MFAMVPCFTGFHMMCPSGRAWLEAAGQGWGGHVPSPGSRLGPNHPSLRDMNKGGHRDRCSGHAGIWDMQTLCLWDAPACPVQRGELLFSISQNRPKMPLMAVAACLQMMGSFKICHSLLSRLVLVHPVLLACQCC